MRFLPLILLASLLTFASHILYAQEAPLRMLYDLRPPLVSMQNGQLEGTVGGRAHAALERSRLRFTLEESPVLRQDAEVRHALTPVCAIGRLYSPERAVHGVFSIAITRGPRYMAITRRDSPPSGPANLAAWTNQPKLRWIVQRGFYYSEAIHRQMHASEAQLIQISRSNSKLSQLLLTGRGDFTLLQEDEARVLLESPAAQDKLKSIPLSDLPEGENRYFYCSHTLPPGTLEKLNSALRIQP